VGTYRAPTADVDDYAATRTRLDDMIVHVSGPVMMSAAQEELEDWLNEAGRELKRQLMQDHLDARARAEARIPALTGADGIERRRAEPGHRRQLATTVGMVEVERIAYRAPKAANLHVADTRLALPAQRYSYPLQRLVATEAVRGSARAASESVTAATGQQLGTQQVMECAVRAACDVLDFYRQDLPTPAPATDLLVLSSDATGVSMINEDLREATRAAAKAAAEQEAGTAAGQAPSAQLSRPDRAGRKRMATVTACYDATPVPRTVADILPANRAEREARTKGPRARTRQLDASLERSTATMVSDLFDAAERRDPDHRRRWIVLVDGANHQLDCIKKEAAARGVTVDIIVDIVHVIEYVWRCADDLHPDKSARTAWVADTVHRVLEGKSARVVADIRAVLRAGGHSEGAKPAAERAVDYLTAKQPYLHYHHALTLGWPIATQVASYCASSV
jgi:hypothetical protein